MKKYFCFSTLLVLALTFTGCMYWPRAGQNGLFYTDTTSPVASVAHDQSPPMKVGRACSSGALGLWAAGDSSIEKAKKDGGITKIANVEEEFHQVFLGFYTRYCTIVSGW